MRLETVGSKGGVSSARASFIAGDRLMHPSARLASMNANSPARDAFTIVAHTLVFDSAGRLLLLRRANTGFLDGYYAPPGGHRKRGEPVTEAAIRECREETGVAPGRIAPVVAMPYAEGVNFVFEAIRWHGVARICEPHRCDALTFAAPEALPSPTVAWLKTALACRADGVWFSEFAASAPPKESAGRRRRESPDSRTTP